MIPETIAYTYRALRIVQKFGAVGCTIGQYGNAAYTSKGAGHNRVAARVLMMLEMRCLVAAIGEVPSEGGKEWERTARSNRRFYALSEAGEAFLRAQVAASQARARELAALAAEMPSPSAQAPSQEGDPSAVGTWEP